MKRGLLGFPLFVLLIQVVSAQFFSGYGRFSITDFFNNIDSSTITLGLLFFIFFALIFYALSRVFKDPYGQPNKGIAGTIAFAVSLLMIYGIYRSGFNLENLFYGLGIGEGALYLIASIILLIAAFFLIKKIRFCGFLIVFGLFLILLNAFTDIFYEKGLVSAIGIILFIVGILLSRRGRRKRRGPRLPREPRSRKSWLPSRSLREPRPRREARPRRLPREPKPRREPRPRRLPRESVSGTGRDVRATKNLRRAESAAYREDAKRQKKIEKQNAEQAKRQQAQEQIQQINNEITRLQQMIPGASVIERGKIEDQIRALLKRAKKLR